MLKIRRIALDTMATTPRRPAPPPSEPASIPNLISILKHQGLLGPDEEEQLLRLMKVQQLSEEGALRRLGKHGEDDITQAVARHANLPYLKINPLDLDLDVVTSALPAPFARKHTMCAVSKHGNTVTLAIANPFNRSPLRDLQQFAGLEVKLVVASRSDLEMVHQGFYDLKSSLKAAETQLTEGRVSAIDIGNQEFLSGPGVEMDPTMQPVVTALDNMLSHAFDQRASDIHMEPERNIALVRLRIDGVLHDVHVI